MHSVVAGLRKNKPARTQPTSVMHFSGRDAVPAPIFRIARLLAHLIPGFSEPSSCRAFIFNRLHGWRLKPSSAGASVAWFSLCCSNSMGQLSLELLYGALARGPRKGLFHAAMSPAHGFRQGGVLE